MDCPNCNNAMIVLQMQEVEIDLCVDCEGIWLDSGELEILLQDADRAKELLGSFDVISTDEKARKCPICLKRMEKISAGSVVLDRCKRGDGLWFDKGELKSILDNARLDPEHRIQKFLRDIFKSEIE